VLLFQAKDKDAALPSVGAETQLINEQNGAADGAACTATADGKYTDWFIFDLVAVMLYNN
jgi:hypothetical protein